MVFHQLAVLLHGVGRLDALDRLPAEVHALAGLHAPLLTRDARPALSVESSLQLLLGGLELVIHGTMAFQHGSQRLEEINTT